MALAMADRADPRSVVGGSGSMLCCDMGLLGRANPVDGRRRMRRTPRPARAKEAVRHRHRRSSPSPVRDSPRPGPARLKDGQAPPGHPTARNVARREGLLTTPVIGWSADTVSVITVRG